MMIRKEIDGLDEAKNDEKTRFELEDSDIENPVADSIQHISVGSHLHPISLMDIEASHSDDTAFRHLRKKVVDSLTVILSEEAGTYQNVKLKGNHQVMFLLKNKPV